MNLLDSVFLISAGVLILTIVAVLTNISLENKFKKRSIRVCAVIFVAGFCEWFAYHLGKYDESVITLRKIVKITEYCLTPLLVYVATVAYSKIYHKKIVLIAILAHAIFQIVMLHFDLVIYFEGGNIYHHGKLYWIYIVVFCLSGIGFFLSTIREELRLYKTMEPILIATLIFIALGLTIQMVGSDLRIDYLCVAIGNYFMFAHRAKMIMQMDGLTDLLNRKCFEEDIKKAKPSVALVVMDLNKFKYINDTYGHRVGDISLQKISNIIIDIYGRYGSCYRIGGDEFAVIIHKKIDQIEELNKAFTNKVNKLNEQDERLPTVAIGYTIYNDKDLLINEAYKIADKHMFEAKRNENK